LLKNFKLIPRRSTGYKKNYVNKQKRYPNLCSSLSMRDIKGQDQMIVSMSKYREIILKFKCRLDNKILKTRK